MAPTRATLAGRYVSNQIPEVGRDGLQYHRESIDFTLTLYGDGTFWMWSDMYRDGEIVRFSGLGKPYEAYKTCRGTWTSVGVRLILRSVEVEHVKREETSEAIATKQGGHWVIDWNGTECLFREALPYHAPEATPAQRPAAAPPSGSGAPQR